MKLDAYVDLLRSGKYSGQKVSGLCGRIIRGKAPRDFETLTDDPERKIVMLVDPDGLQGLLGKTGYDMLITVGYEPGYLEHKVQEGNRFKLVVFPEGGAAQLATWDNMFRLVREAYPDISRFLDQNEDLLKKIPFSEIEKLAGYAFLDVEKVGKQDSRFMTYERLLSSRGSLVDIRAFLYFTVHLREQYAGDGWTYTASGEKGVLEYIILNKPLVELGEHRLVDIDVHIPSSVKQKVVKKMSKKVHLVIIDPQNDFMDIPNATLPVVGANADMDRVADLIRRSGHKFEDIHVTMDSHREIDVGHATMWEDARGNNPSPFTLISAQDIEKGTWVPRDRSRRQHMADYAHALEAGGKYQIMVWPTHCLIGTPGWCVQGSLMQALREWERREFANVDYVTKGLNPWTEHYGGLEAEVPDPSDPTTGLNTGLIRVLQMADLVLLCGEALSHCVMATVNQIIANIGDVSKLVILTDCTSPVGAMPDRPDFPAMAKQWLKDIEKQGVRLMKSTDF